MNPEILNAGQVGIELTELMMPFIGALLLLVATLWFKDFAASIAKGMNFRMNGAFNEGDKVILDGENAVIVKIGITQTVFGIQKPDKRYCWRYIPNERIHMIKLEKIILDKKGE